MEEEYELHPARPPRPHGGCCQACRDRIARLNAEAALEEKAAAAAQQKPLHAQLLPRAAARATT